MDGLVTYVDLAETANPYSFQLTGLQSGGWEVKQERQKEEHVEKEVVVGKRR